MLLFNVDVLNPEKTMGICIDPEKFKKNLSLIDPGFVRDFVDAVKSESNSDVTRITSSGRYIIIVQLNKVEQEGQLAFVDTKNDVNMALDLYNIVNKKNTSASIMNRFMDVFTELQPHYKERYYFTELFSAPI